MGNSQAVRGRVHAILLGAIFACVMALVVALPSSAYAANGELVHFKFDGNYKTSVGGISTVHYGNSKFASGKLGKAAFFDGDGDYVTVGRGLNLTGDYAINFWVKPAAGNETRSDAAILAKYETNHYGPYDFYLQYNKPAFWMSYSNGTHKECVSDTAVANGKWSMITYSYKKSAKQLSIYINGKYDTSFEVDPLYSNNDLVTIGRQAFMFAPYSHVEYLGWLDELTLYNKSLTTGEIKSLYRQAGSNISKAKVGNVAKNYTYTGKSVQPSPRVVFGSKVLTRGVDYTVTYKNNGKLGTAQMTITGIGKYAGTKTVKFKLVPKGTNVKTLKEGNKKLTVAWAKQTKKTSGYQIRYSTEKSMKGAKLKTVMSPKKTKVTLTGLKNGKIYWVQVRTYAKIGNSLYYSSWSGKKSATVGWWLAAQSSDNALQSQTLMAARL